MLISSAIGQLAQQLLEVRAEVHRDGLAAQVLDPLDRVVALAHHDLGAVVDVGLGEDELRLALGGDGDLVRDRVETPGLERADQPGEGHGAEFGRVAGLGGDGVHEVDLEALELVLADEGEGEVAARHADADGFGGGRKRDRGADKGGGDEVFHGRSSR